MARESMPNEEPAATLRTVALRETDTSHKHGTGRAGAMSAPARLAAFLPALRLLAYAIQGALVGVLLLVVAAQVPVLFGYHTYVVNGGSMEPTLKAGSVAVSKPTSPRELEVGDIIVRRLSSDSPPVIHRIVDIITEEASGSDAEEPASSQGAAPPATSVSGRRLFITQGDQNGTPDPEPLAIDAPGDRVVYSVPYAGYILNFAGSGLGRAALIGVPLALLAANFLRERRLSPQRKEEAGTQIPVATERQPVLPPDVVTFIKPQAVDRDLPAFLVQQLAQAQQLERRAALLASSGSAPVELQGPPAFLGQQLARVRQLERRAALLARSEAAAASSGSAPVELHYPRRKQRTEGWQQEVRRVA